MDNDVQIVISTPFSIYNYPSGILKAHQPHIKSHEDYMNHMYSDDRLNTKFDAFEHVSVPSINRQTYQNYIWNVVHSPHLPEVYMDRLKRIAQTTPRMKLIPVEDFSSFIPAISNALPKSRYINVRLDDDDALHPGYFDLLASHYKPGRILSPVNGYKVSNYSHAKQKGKASIFNYLPKVCAASGLAACDKNVNSLGRHTHIHLKNKDIKYLKQKGLFLRMIHDHNLGTSKNMKNKFPISVDRYMKGARHQTRKHLQKGGGTTRRFEELGEGRSTSIYIQPKCTDTAILIAFYNPVPFKRILNNALYIIKILKEKQIPCYVVECVFDDRKPELPHADLHVRSNSYMFYKEQLMNKLEAIVPEQYTKLVFLDADIVFDSPDWVDQISIALDRNDIIQPYDKACWLMPGNKIIRSWKYSYGHAMLKNIPITQSNIHIYHPGFAWAFKRKMFRNLGGFYPNAIIGGGDMLFTFNFFQDVIPEYWYKNTMITTLPIQAWPEYHARFKQHAPKVGTIDIRALHLFHGLSLNRQYKTRYQKFAHHFTGSWDQYITYNTDGLTEFKDPKDRHLLLPYFKERNEDIPLEEAIKVSEKSLVRGKVSKEIEPPKPNTSTVNPV
jgi:hypothetical protein